MAAKQPTLTPRYCIQNSRFTKQDGWQLRDLSLSSNGNIAVTGYTKNTHRTYIDVYTTNVRHSDSRDKPKIIYTKEFEEHVSEGRIYRGRLVSFYPDSDTTILSGLGDKLEVIDLIQDRIMKSRKIKLIKPEEEIKCLSVRETEIFIGFWKSDKISVYDVIDINEIKSIILQGIHDGCIPFDMTAIADRVFVCVDDGREESNHKSMIFEEKNGRILSELTKPTDTVQWYVEGLASNITLNVVAVAWSQTLEGKRKGTDVIVFYSLLSENNCSFLIVEVEIGVWRIRISDRGDKMITGNRGTKECKVYDMAEFLTYRQLKQNLASQLQVDDCVRLMNYFALPKDQSEAILYNSTLTENFLSVLEETGVIQSSNVDRLIDAFRDLNISSSCYHLVDFYKRTRIQATSYDKFLATLSAHLIASLPSNLCDFFNITDENKISIISSQNPGLSLLLSLDEMGIIKQSEVAALEPPFTEMKLVQAVAMIHEYQSIVEEGKTPFLGGTEITVERKREFFVQCLQRKLKSWYETMTPVPWRKSCTWSVLDLFVGSGLILTNSKSKRSLLDVDEQCKVKSKEIFCHDRLKHETRIVLEGDPGCGKTMLMSQLAYDWSHGKLNDIKLLILLPLKFVQQRTLVEAIKEFYVPEDKRLSISDIEKFLDDKQNPAHLLLDGLEEYSGKLKQEKSEVREIMSRKKYPFCKVLISSRSDFAKDFPKIPMLKLGAFGKKQRSCYIEKLFPEDAKKQIGTKQIIDDSPIIQDLCRVPLLFVLAVHNVEKIEKAQIGRLDRVTPFVESMVNTLCPAESLISKTQELVLEDQVQKETPLEELAYNGLCRGSQQLYWQKEFFDEKIQNSKEWIDSGVLVLEESNYSVLIDEKDQHAQSADTKTSYLNVTKGEEADGQSDAAMHSQMRAGEDSDNDSGARIGLHQIDKESVTIAEGVPNARHVPLQVRFLHKIIQEWFAAKYFSTMISRVNLDHLEKYLYEHLLLINPADLHHVLRFTSALYPSSCHVIIKHLLSYRTEEGDVPEYIMDFIFLCLAEYTGDYNPNILEVLSEICMENIMIHSDDSRLLQQSKVMLLEVASSHGISVRKLLLTDLVVSVKEDLLQFNSGIMMIVLDTLEVIELSRWDQALKEEDYSNILKFIAQFPMLRKARLNFPDQPPRVDKDTAVCLQEKDLTVTWTIGSKLSHVLDTQIGKWKLLGEMLPTVRKEYAITGAYRIEHQQTTKLEAEAAISREGGKLEIPETGVRLYVPPNAFDDNLDQRLLQMRIISPGTFDEPATSFTSNTSTVVELLPNNLKLKQTVILTLPHCLDLEVDRGDGSYTANVFISHHEKGTSPVWEEQPQLLYYLDDTKCSVWLERFCWVKVQVNGAIVKGKKIQVYTAGKELVHGDDIAELEVGYYPDLPGGGEILRNNESLILLLKKPFIFLKKGKRPLTLLLEEVVPGSWKPVRISQEIPFQCIADSEERSCPFVFENKNKVLSLPVFIFWISQGARGFRLSMRPRALPTVLANQSDEKISESEDPLLDCFLFLKTKLFKEWKDFGRYLRLSEDKISRVSCENKHNVGECIYQMLLTWQRENGSRATSKKLVEALEKLGRKDLAESLPYS